MEGKNEVSRKQTSTTDQIPLISITALNVRNWRLGLTPGRGGMRADPTAPAPRADQTQAGGRERLDLTGWSQQGAAAATPTHGDRR